MQIFETYDFSYIHFQQFDFDLDCIRVPRDSKIVSCVGNVATSDLFATFSRWLPSVKTSAVVIITSTVVFVARLHNRNTADP